MHKHLLDIYNTEFNVYIYAVLNISYLIIPGIKLKHEKY